MPHPDPPHAPPSTVPADAPRGAADGGAWPVISLCTDYGRASEGVGLMHGAILAVTRNAHVVDLTHEVEPFDLVNGARQMETVLWMPAGIHVCVVDPGVGSPRAALALETARGDVLVGPDNGVLIPATHRLGGIRRCFAIENPAVMRQPVSDTFHGRDVFATCAGWLARGVAIETVGRELSPGALAPAAFTDAIPDAGGRIDARIIHVNRFGSTTLNVTVAALAGMGVRHGDRLSIRTARERFSLPYVRTFSDVPAGVPIALADPYERLAFAVNLGSFTKEKDLERGAHVELCRE